jgi:hypothetical protein
MSIWLVRNVLNKVREWARERERGKEEDNRVKRGDTLREEGEKRNEIERERGREYS